MYLCLCIAASVLVTQLHSSDSAQTCTRYNSRTNASNSTAVSTLRTACAATPAHTGKHQPPDRIVPISPWNSSQLSPTCACLEARGCDRYCCSCCQTLAGAPDVERKGICKANAKADFAERWTTKGPRARIVRWLWVLCVFVPVLAANVSKVLPANQGVRS